MIAFKLDRRHDAVTQAEFERSKRNLWIIAVIWVTSLVAAMMMVDIGQWYYLAGLVLIFILTLPSPSELFQSFEGYKKKWLQHGGSTRGDRAKFNR